MRSRAVWSPQLCVQTLALPPGVHLCGFGPHFWASLTSLGIGFSWESEDGDSDNPLYGGRTPWDDTPEGVNYRAWYSKVRARCGFF